MGYEILVFGVMTIFALTNGLGRVFHYKSKKEISPRTQTTGGLISLFLGTLGIYYLLKMGEII